MGSYEKWAYESGFTPFVSTNPSLPTSDPDSDGRVNLMEFALGTDPLVADAIPANRLNSFMQPGGYYTLGLNKPRHDTTHLRYEAEGSLDLKSWRTSILDLNVGGFFGDLEWTFDRGLDAYPQGMLRLSVRYPCFNE